MWISIYTPLGEAQKFHEKYGWRFPSLLDTFGRKARRLGTRSVPAFVVIDARGRIVMQWVGVSERRNWEYALTRARL